MKAFHYGTLPPSWHLLGKKNRDDETPEMPEKNLSSTPNRTDDHIKGPKETDKEINSGHRQEVTKVSEIIHNLKEKFNK